MLKYRQFSNLSLNKILILLPILALSIGTVILLSPNDNSPVPLAIASVDPKQVGSEGGSVAGWVHIEVYDSTGNTKYVSDDHNLIVTEGLQSTSDLLFGTTHTTGESVGGFTHIQLGTGTTNPAAGNTDCETPAGSKVDDTVVVNTVTGAILNATYTSQLDGLSLSEICLTDSNTNATGNLFARQEYTPFTFNSGDTVNATWTITFEDSDGT